VKAVLVLPLALLSGWANSQTFSETQAYFECGAAACANAEVAAYGNATGINDLNVRGDLFDVSFSTTATGSSPFSVSRYAALPGRPLTGVDAATAINAFYQSIPLNDGYEYADPGPALITAFSRAAPGTGQYSGSTLQLFDVAQTIVGMNFNVNGTPVPDTYKRSDSTTTSKTYIPLNYYGPLNTANLSHSGVTYYTTWTPVAVPEIDPNFTGSAMALLIGGLALLSGRRRPQA